MMPSYAVLAKHLDALFHSISTLSNDHADMEYPKRQLSSCNFKEETTFFCSFCPYNNDLMSELKCHILLEHPISPIIVTNKYCGTASYNLSDVTFLCVREACSHATTKCNVYEEHLMSCCSFNQTLSEVEAKRLSSSLHFVLDLEKKHYLNTFSRFLKFTYKFSEMCAADNDVIVTSLELHELDDDVCKNVDTPEPEEFSVDIKHDENNERTNEKQNDMGSSKSKDLKSQNGHSLNEDGHFPNGDGHFPSEDGHFHNEDGHFPNEDEHSLNEDGNFFYEDDRCIVSTTCDARRGCEVKGTKPESDVPSEYSVNYENLSQSETEIEEQHFVAVDENVILQDDTEIDFPDGRANNFDSSTLQSSIINKQAANVTDIRHCHLTESSLPDTLLFNEPVRNWNEEKEAHNTVHKNTTTAVISINTDILEVNAPAVSLDRFQIEDEHIDNVISLGKKGTANAYTKDRQGIGEENAWKCGENILMKRSLSDKSFNHRSDYQNHLQAHSGKKSFKCELCYKVYETSPSLLTHMKTHAVGDLMICKECGKTFRLSSLASFIRHIQRHVNRRPFTCDVCGKTLKHKDSLNKHMKIHELEKPFNCNDLDNSSKIIDRKPDPARRVDVRKYQETSLQCNICSESFAHKCYLYDHMRTHAVGEQFRCDECGRTFPLYHCATFTKHLQTHVNEKPIQCNYCGKMLKHRYSFTKHIKIHSKERWLKCNDCNKSFVQPSYRCNVCNESFVHKYHMYQHMRIHIVGGVITCNECGRSFPSSKFFKYISHVETHIYQMPLTCDQCGKVLKNQDARKRHLRIHTEEYDGHELFKCHVCDRAYPSERNRARHMKMHTAEKTYLCSVCGKGFKQRQYLTSHIRTHTGEKPYKCNVCTRGFREKGSLNIHMRTHTGERPFKCKICGKGFINTSGLCSHERQHLGIKKFKCDICDHKFSRKNGLTLHMRLHTGERPFKCETCGMVFTGIKYLRKHENLHAKGTTATDGVHTIQSESSHIA